jgi:hypothetical protein
MLLVVTSSYERACDSKHDTWFVAAVATEIGVIARVCALRRYQPSMLLVVTWWYERACNGEHDKLFDAAVATEIEVPLQLFVRCTDTSQRMLLAVISSAALPRNNRTQQKGLAAPEGTCRAKRTASAKQPAHLLQKCAHIQLVCKRWAAACQLHKRTDDHCWMLRH